MGSGAELLTGPGLGQPQDGGRQGQAGAEVEGYGREAFAQPFPQEHVRSDRGGEEPHSPPQPQLKVWRHGHSRGSCHRVGNHPQEVAQPPNGGDPDLVPVQNQGVRQCQHNFFPNAFDYNALKIDSPRDRLKNYEVAFVTGEKFAGVPDFLTAEDMSAMVEEKRIDPKMIFSYVQEVYRMCNEL